METKGFEPQLAEMLLEIKEHPEAAEVLFTTHPGQELLAILLDLKPMTLFSQNDFVALRPVIVLEKIRSFIKDKGLITQPVDDEIVVIGLTGKKILGQQYNDFLSGNLNTLSVPMYGALFGFPKAEVAEFSSFSTDAKGGIVNKIFSNPEWKKIIQNNQEYADVINDLYVDYGTDEDTFAKKLQHRATLQALLAECSQGEYSAEEIDYFVNTVGVHLPGFTFRARYPFTPEVRNFIAKVLSSFQTASELADAPFDWEEYRYLLE